MPKTIGKIRLINEIILCCLVFLYGLGMFANSIVEIESGGIQLISDDLVVALGLKN